MIIRIHSDKVVREFMNSVPYPEQVPETMKICKSNTIVLAWYIRRQITGLFLFQLFKDAIEIHACFKKEFRGNTAVIAARNAFAWIFKNTKYDRIIAEISEPHVQQYAERCGMFRTGDQYEVGKWEILSAR